MPLQLAQIMCVPSVVQSFLALFGVALLVARLFHSLVLLPLQLLLLSSVVFPLVPFTSLNYLMLTGSFAMWFACVPWFPHH